MTDREKIIYDILCSDEQPPEGQHWEGFVTNKIVAALAQPEQEPVAWKMKGVPAFATSRPNDTDSIKWDALYTAPPQREWQGLTDEEIQDMWSDHCRNWQRLGKVLISPTVFGQAIEAKLKQKNYQSALHNMNKAAEKNGEEL